MRSARPSRRTSETGATRAASSKAGPAEEGGRVERLGDALTRLRIRGISLKAGTDGSSGADAPIDEPPACPRCKDIGFLRRNVPAGDPEFGQMSICPCKKQVVAERRQS